MRASGLASSPSLPVVSSVPVARSRSVEHLVEGREVTDGDGVRIRRLLTGEWQQRLDPWLMMDLFRNNDPRDYLGGFPDHPHRGFETITYMLAGRMRHRDSAGHEGLLESGGVQWMTAGRGVIHSEMPQQQDGLMEGVQLWLNLPAADKGQAPWYRDFQQHEIPQFCTEGGVRVRVIAGASHGVAGAVQRAATAPLYLDIHLPAGSSYAQPLLSAHHAFIVVYRGSAWLGHSPRTRVQADQLAILGQDGEAEGVLVRVDEDCHLLLVAGQPLHEPIVQHGPFVMNSEAEIRQAFADYRAGRLA